MTESRYATLSEVKLHYLEDGEGDVVVLLHGWPHTSHSWRHVMPKLSARRSAASSTALCKTKLMW